MNRSQPAPNNNNHIAKSVPADSPRLQTRDAHHILQASARAVPPFEALETLVDT